MLNFILMVVFLSHVAFASEDPPFNDRTHLPPINVSNAVIGATTSRPQAMIAHEKVELAKQDVRSFRSTLLPDSSASSSWNQNQNNLMIGPGRAITGMTGVNVSQTVFNLPAVYFYQAAKIRLKAAISQLNSDDLKFAGQAISTYMDVLKLRITLDLAAENYFFLRDLIESMKNGKLKDKVTEDDIKLAEGAFGSALSEKHIWIQEETISENNFSLGTSLDPAEYFLLEPTALPIPENAESAIALALQNNPDLASARALLAASKRDLKGARAGRQPRVDAMASVYNFQRPPGELNEFHMSGASVGVTVSVPLFDGGRRGAAIGSQKIRQNISAFQVQAQVLDLQNSLKNTYVQIKERAIRLKGLCEGLKNRLDTVSSKRNRFIEQISVQDVLSQKQALEQNGIALNNEFLSDIIDTYNIHIQMGTLLNQLPVPTEPVVPITPNPQCNGYLDLLKRCVDQKYIETK